MPRENPNTTAQPLGTLASTPTTPPRDHRNLFQTFHPARRGNHYTHSSTIQCCKMFSYTPLLEPGWSARFDDSKGVAVVGFIRSWGGGSRWRTDCCRRRSPRKSPPAPPRPASPARGGQQKANIRKGEPER